MPNFRVKSEKIYTGQKKFTQAPLVVLVTNIRYAKIVIVCIFLQGHYLPVIGVLGNHWSLNKLQAMMIFSFAWHNCAWCESIMTIWCCYRSWCCQQLSSNKMKQYWWLCLWAPWVMAQFVGYMLLCPFYIICKVVNIFSFFVFYLYR